MTDRFVPDRSVPDRFVYVTYIRTTPEALWEALTAPDFTKRYWYGCWQDCRWTKGADWKLMLPDGRVGDSGEVLEIDPPRRLVVTWRNEWKPELREEGESRCIFEIEPAEGATKLVIVHEIDRQGSRLIEAVSGGWPRILSNLKTLLETGEALGRVADWKESA